MTRIKKIFALEIHHYAPEMTKAILYRRRVVNGERVLLSATFKVPGCTTVREARQRLFRPMPFMIGAEVRKEYPAPYEWLNQTYKGRVIHRRDALRFANELRDKSQGGPLWDGSVLPPAVVTVRTFTKGG